MHEQHEIQATVLLEKVEKVFKLVTVEGIFNEVYDDKSIKEYTVFLPLPSTFKFSKTATIQVQGKVLVGYDMEGITLTVDSLHKEIILNNMPKNAEILAIDHDVSYKNLDDSFFNSFKPSDYTKLHNSAKDVIRQKALESRLMDEAQEQGNQVIEIVRVLVESAGYKLVYIKNNERAPISTLSD